MNDSSTAVAVPFDPSPAAAVPQPTPVSHAEARKIAQRFIDKHFGNVHADGTTNWPTTSIPAEAKATAPSQTNELGAVASNASA